MMMRERTQAAAFDLTGLLGDLCRDGPWEGSASELLDELAARVPEERRPDTWPTNGKVLSGRLRAGQEELYEAGIALRFRKIGGGRRLITITRVEADEPMPSPVEAEMPSDVVAHLYILASPARVWSALTDGNLLRQSTGFSLEGRWDPGQPIALRSARSGRDEYTGTVTNLSYPWLLQTSWRCDWAEGAGMLSFEFQERDGWAEVMVSLQHPSAHVVWVARSYWPALLCAAKTAIETGKLRALHGVVVRPPIFERPEGRWGDA